MSLTPPVFGPMHLVWTEILKLVTDRPVKEKDLDHCSKWLGLSKKAYFPVVRAFSHSKWSGAAPGSHPQQV